MEPLVDVVTEDARWDALGLEPLADRAVRATLFYMGFPQVGFTLCVMGCDDARIAVLNGEFRDKAGPTNVLSWPEVDLSHEVDGHLPHLIKPGPLDDPQGLGDMALSYDTCAREADEAGKPMADHVTHLVVHGLLHLLGYDHVRDGDAARMERNEAQILASLGLSDPYL